MYDSDDDDIGEDLDDLRRACIVSDSDSNSGGVLQSDSENEDDFEMLRSVKTKLASSPDHPMGLSSLPSDSDSQDDFEMLRSLKRQLALPMDQEDEDDETLFAICKRFSSYENSGELICDLLVCSL